MNADPSPLPLAEWLSLLPAPAWVGTPGGDCVHVNPALSNLLGAPQAQLLNRGWLQFLSPAARSPALRWLLKRSTLRTRFRARFWIHARKRAQRLYVQARVLPLSRFTEDLVLVTFQDKTPEISAPQSSQLRSEQLRLCFENAPIGIGFLDLDLSFIQANPALRRILSSAPLSLERRPLELCLENRLPPASALEIARICSQTILTGSPHALHGWPLDSPQPEGTQHVTDWEIRRIDAPDHSPVGLLLTVSDVTRQKYIEERLRLLAGVLETTPDFVAVFSPEGGVLYLNRSARETAGIDADTPVHHLHYTNLQPAWAAKLLREQGFPTALRSGSWEGETGFKSISGTPIPVSQILYAHKNSSGQVEFLSSILRDITESLQFREQLAKAQETLEQRVNERTAELAKATALISDRVRQQAAVASLGETALTGSSIATLIEESNHLVLEILRVDFCALRELSEDRQQLHLLADLAWPECLNPQSIPASETSPFGLCLLSGDPVIFENLENETLFNVPDGLRDAGCVSGMTVSIASGDEPFGTLGVFSRRAMQFSKNDAHFLQSVANVIAAAIQRQKAEAGLRRAMQQAESANQAKSAFLSRMSHELRTPLNAILGFAQLLGLEDPTPSQVESIGHITRAGRHLLSLINEVLDIARIEAGRLALTIEPVELNAFLHNTLELMRPIAASTHITLQFTPNEHPFHVRADRQRLKQVALNFLSNAIKYNTKGGTVQVCVSLTQNTARFEVRDSGPGIPPEKHNALFKPFERLGAEVGGVEGTGIGLALCKGFIETMGGSIGLESPENGGCVFWAQLPLADPLETPQRRIEKLPNPLASEMESLRQNLPKILVVESHDLDLQLAEKLIQKNGGCEIISSMQGSLGLELAKEHLPALLLLDIELPDITPNEFLARLRANLLLKNIPVVLLCTEEPSQELERLALTFNAEFLLKPYDPATLLKILDSVLLRHHTGIKNL
jgi:signal transduction histidine kinase/PAS domain-containing protein